jgi:hypothetical protein
VLLNFVAGTINDVSGASSAARQAQVAALAPIEKARFLTSERLNLARQIAQVDAGGLKAPEVRALQDEIRLRRDNIRVLEATGALEALRAARVLPAVTVTGSTARSFAAGNRGRAAARAVVAAFDNEMQGILRTAGQIELGGLVVPGFESAAVTAFDRVTSALVRQQDQTSEAAAKLRDYRRELLNIPAVELLRGTGAALAARLQVTVTPSVTVNPVITAANIDLREIIRAPNLDGCQRAATAASNGLGAVRSAAEAARAGLGDTRGALANFADALDTAARAAGALEQLADVARRPGAVIGRTASGGVDAFATISNFANIAGAVGSLASIVGGLLNDPVAAAAAQATRANTDELARVRSELSGFGRSLGDLGRVERMAREVISRNPLLQPGAQRVVPGGIVTRGQDQIEAQLRSAGLSLADLDRVAREYNITLLQNGRLLGAGLSQLAERLDLARTAALRWAEGFAGQVDRLDFAARVLDLDTSGVEAAQRTLNESAAIFGRLTSEAPQLYARLFAGLDVNTAAGREALNARLNTLVEDLLSDEFTAGRGALYEAIRNSGFANLEEFRGFILRTDDALDEFATATRAATNALGSLGSVPEVFKRNLAALQFQYQAPYMPPPRPAPAPTPTPAPYRPDGYTPARPGMRVDQHFGPGSIASTASTDGPRVLPGVVRRSAAAPRRIRRSRRSTRLNPA